MSDDATVQSVSPGGPTDDAITGPTAILPDRRRYPSIDDVELPLDQNYVLLKPPRSGGSFTLMSECLSSRTTNVILANRHSILEEHFATIEEENLVDEAQTVVWYEGYGRACSHGGVENCPLGPTGQREYPRLTLEVESILRDERFVTFENAPGWCCNGSFIQAAADAADVVLTVPQLLPRLDRDWSGANLVIDEEQAIDYFRPSSVRLLEVGIRTDSDGLTHVAQVADHSRGEIGALREVAQAIDTEYKRPPPFALDIVDAVEYLEELRDALGVTKAAEEMDGLDATIDELTNRAMAVERPEPRTEPDRLRRKLGDYISEFYWDDNVSPGALLETVWWPYQDRPFDWKPTGYTQTLRAIGDREGQLFHRDLLNEFAHIAVIAGPEGELLLDELDRDACAIEVEEFPYEDRFVIVPMDTRAGAATSTGKQRKKARRVGELLNDSRTPHIAIVGTKAQAHQHVAQLDEGAEVVTRPNPPAVGMWLSWNAGGTAVIYENSVVSRGIDIPCFDIAVVVAPGFARPYWEARHRRYEDDDPDEANRAAAIERTLKRRELTNGVLRMSPTKPTENDCGTKFIVAAVDDVDDILHIGHRTLPTQSRPRTVANMLSTLVAPGPSAAGAEAVYDVVGSGRAFMEHAMTGVHQKDVDDRPTYTLEELTEWLEADHAFMDPENLDRVERLRRFGIDGRELRERMSTLPNKHVGDLLDILHRRGRISEE